MSETRKFIDEVVSIKYSDREEPVTGMVIDYNDDWTLLINNPFDFMNDGYSIISHNNLYAFKQEEEEEQVEKVFALKGAAENKPDTPLDNVSDILTHLSSCYGLFQLELNSSDEDCYVGKLKMTTDDRIVITSMDTDAEWNEDINIKTSDIRIIEFGTDYLKSLLLLNEANT